MFAGVPTLSARLISLRGYGTLIPVFFKGRKGKK